MRGPEVILVDDQDNPLGTIDKMEAHVKGLLHRAFSIFIFNSKGEMLLQQRAKDKYHSGGLWTNACCSHPLPGEDISVAATRRLKEELGFSIPLKRIFDFTYQTDVGGGLIENEFDHVFIGYYDGLVNFNPEEVSDVCYKTPGLIGESIKVTPGAYTAWFLIAFPKIEQWVKQQKQMDKSSN